MISAAILSLAFSYIPGLSDRYGALAPEIKRLIMAGLMVLVAAGAFGLSCAGILEGVTCDPPGVVHLVWVVVLAITANQSVYQLSKRGHTGAG